MPTAYLSPSQLQDLTNVSSNAPGSGDNGKALVWNWNSTTGTGQWQAQQVAYSNLSGAPALPIPVANGGTGTQTGSITGTGALTFAAGGTNQNLNLVPSGTGLVTFDSCSLGQDPSSPGALEQLGVPRPKMLVKSNQQMYIEYFTASNNPVDSPVFLLFRSRGNVINFDTVSDGDRLGLIGCLPIGIESNQPALGNQLTGFLINVDGPVTARNPPTRMSFIGTNSAGGAVDFARFNSTRVQIPQGTQSDSTTTGALQVSGGTGITGNLNVGGTINGLGAVQPGGPASATAAGTAGQVRWDDNYIYVCTATNTWKRVAISTW